jgi:hypothetical protein
VSALLCWRLMATTFRQVINRVLRTVAEDEIDSGVTELSDSYQKLVASFVNQIKEEIEDSHNWRSLRTVVPVTITSGQNSASLAISSRSRLLRVQDSTNGQLIPLAFDVTNTSSRQPIYEVDANELAYLQNIDNVTTGPTARFTVSVSTTDADVLTLSVWPKVEQNRNYELTFIVPQEYFEDDELDEAIDVPSRPLIIGSIWYALEERGEELGASSLYTEERYRKALDDAISIDAAEQGGYDLIPV